MNGDEVLLGAPAKLMNGIGDQFLAGTRLPLQQHGCLGRRHPRTSFIICTKAGERPIRPWTSPGIGAPGNAASFSA
jgi:hypothetical protein